MSLENEVISERGELLPLAVVSNASLEKSREKSFARGDNLTSAKQSPALFPQVLGGGVSALVQVGLGMVGGYSGVTIPQLTRNDTTTPEIVFDDQQIALFSSLVYLTAFAGCLLGIIPTVRFGPRVTMIMCLPILLSGWIALAFSSTIWMIQASRCLIGITIGVIESASYQYTTEISHSRIRGMMVGSLDTMRQLGIMLVFGLGATNMTWQQISLVSGCATVPPVLIPLIFLPNSPRWLVTQGRKEEASKSLTFYRGSQYDITSELRAISLQLEETSGKTTLTFLSQLQMLMDMTIIKIISFLTFLFLAAQFTGNIVVIAYVVPIFEVADISMNSFMAAIIVGGIRVIGTICSLLFVDYVGRKPALIVSFLACGSSLMTLGVYFFLKDQYGDVQSIDWMPLTSIVVFVFFSCVGHPTLNLIRGELLPATVRSAAMPFLCSILFGGLFLASQTYPLMTSLLNTSGTFWFYGAMCILVLVFTIPIIPETRQEILENITFVGKK